MRGGSEPPLLRAPMHGFGAPAGRDAGRRPALQAASAVREIGVTPLRACGGLCRLKPAFQAAGPFGGV